MVTGFGRGIFPVAAVVLALSFVALSPALGKEISGKWVPFRELEHGKTWNPLFEQRCEKPLKRIADALMEYICSSDLSPSIALPIFWSPTGVIV